MLGRGLIDQAWFPSQRAAPIWSVAAPLLRAWSVLSSTRRDGQAADHRNHPGRPQTPRKCSDQPSLIGYKMGLYCGVWFFFTHWQTGFNEDWGFIPSISPMINLSGFKFGPNLPKFRTAPLAMGSWSITMNRDGQEAIGYGGLVIYVQTGSGLRGSGLRVCLGLFGAPSWKDVGCCESWCMDIHSDFPEFFSPRAIEFGVVNPRPRQNSPLSRVPPCSWWSWRSMIPSMLVARLRLSHEKLS